LKLIIDSAIFNQLDLYGALQHIAWAGYDGVELACLANWARHIELNTKKSYLEEVKATAKKHGLALSAIHPDVGDLPGEDKVLSLLTMFEIAQKLGIPIVAIRSGGKSDDKEAMKQEIKYLKTLTAGAEARGVTLALNPHTGGSIYNTATAEALLAAIDSPGLGMILDPRELTKAGDNPITYISKIGKKIVHTHFRDLPKNQYEATPEEQILGRGNLPFPEILKALKKTGYNKDIDVLLIGAFTYPLSKQMGLAAECRGYLNRCLQELK
jgi:sugar phosphate isomerase/epimerase